MPSSSVSALDAKEEGKSNVGNTEEEEDKPSFFDIYGTDVCILFFIIQLPICLFKPLILIVVKSIKGC